MSLAVTLMQQLLLVSPHILRTIQILVYAKRIMKTWTIVWGHVSASTGDEITPGILQLVKVSTLLESIIRLKGRENIRGLERLTHNETSEEWLLNEKTSGDFDMSTNTKVCVCVYTGTSGRSHLLYS